MAFQITGKIELIGEIQSRPSKNGGQPFQTREFVLDATRYNSVTGEPWENHPKFELGNSKVNIIDDFKVGQMVTVDFTLRGARYADKQTGEIKYFTSISATKITDAGQSQGAPSQGAPANQPTAPLSTEEAQGESDDDLPF